MSYPGELVPTITEHGIDTLTPIGDRFVDPDVNRIAPDPPPSPKQPVEEVKKKVAASPVGTITDAIDKGDPAELQAALGKLKESPPSVKEHLKKMLDEIKSVQEEEEEKITREDKKTEPSPEEKKKDSKKQKESKTLEEKKIKRPGAKSPQKSSPPEEGASRSNKKKSPEAAKKKSTSVDAPKPLSPEARKEADAQADAQAAEVEPEEEMVTVDNTLTSDGFKKPTPHCPAGSNLPKKKSWGDEIALAISGTCSVVFQLDLPPYERAPFNMHFSLLTRDPKGTKCGGLVMRLRKHCGDFGKDPQACRLPFTGFTPPYIGTHRVREVKMDSNRAALDAYGVRKRLEWFEENSYTRDVKGNSALIYNECGCQDGPEFWGTRSNREEAWYVEIVNENRNPHQFCEVSFVPMAVDICNGHGLWRNGDGCYCDHGYDGQYEGPAEVPEDRYEANDNDFVGADGQNEVGSHTLKDIKTHLSKRTGNFPIEAAPGQVSGEAGSQNSHNLGCRIVTPLVDEFVDHRQSLAAARAGVDRPSSPAVGRNVSDVTDDCSGVVTKNTLLKMTNEQVIACTGRSRSEMISGLTVSTEETNKAADAARKKRSAYLLSQRPRDGWGVVHSPREYVGNSAVQSIKNDEDRERNSEHEEEEEKERARKQISLPK